MKTVKFLISGMHCASCATNIQNALMKKEAINEGHISFATSQAVITFNERMVSEKDIIKMIKDLGYDAEIVSEDKHEFFKHQASVREDYKKRFFLSLIFAFPTFIIGMVLPLLGFETPYMEYILWALATPVQFIIGWPFYRGALYALKNRDATMDTLIALGTTAAYAFSAYNVIFNPRQGQYFEVSAVLITLVILGKWLEAVATGKASEAIEKLIQLSPKTAMVKRKGRFVMIGVEDILKGDLILVKPGEKIAVDGVVVEGSSYVDESMITGESMPVQKTKGSDVFSATVNKNGSFVFKATRVGKDTTLSRIVKLVEEAQANRAPIQRFADRISSVFVPIIILISAMTFFVWYVILNSELTFAMLTSIAVLVIACPCALGLATPTAIMVGTGKGAENGILIKGGEPLEKAYKIKYLILDKTGTITKGMPEVTDIIGGDNVLNIAASLEHMSEHPLAEAIVKKAKLQRYKKVRDFKAISGKGVLGRIDGKLFFFGNKKLMKENKINLNGYKKQIAKLESEGKTVMVLAEKRALGIIAVADTIRENSKTAIKKIEELGIEVYMITGDNERSAKAIAKRVGIKNVFAEVLPEKKAMYVKNLQKKGLVAMVGDGINDAPALAQADIGIAMGSGTDIAMESGDIVLMKNDLADVGKALALSKHTVTKIKQNMFWALIYNIIGIPIAAGILYESTGWLLSPMIAGSAMALSSVSVVGNSLLLKTKKI
ncbi:MAG: heavy metal translocating P-type ATPase [Candidatus Woesearchaeota archaeon]